MNLCQYSQIAGIPGQGVHSYRIFNIAVFDVIGTIIGALILYFLYNKISFWCYLLALFVLSIILHRLFCVRTTIDKILFPDG